MKQKAKTSKRGSPSLRPISPILLLLSIVALVLGIYYFDTARLSMRPFSISTAPLFSPIAARLRSPLFQRFDVASPYTRAMSSDNQVVTTSANTVDSDSFHPSSSSTSEPQGLPAPSDAKGIKLAVGEDGVKLDAMGPMVVNKDGTLSRIANWDKMADIEKQNTLRVLGKRNKQRLEALEKAQTGN